MFNENVKFVSVIYYNWFVLKLQIMVHNEKICNNTEIKWSGSSNQRHQTHCSVILSDTSIWNHEKLLEKVFPFVRRNVPAIYFPDHFDTTIWIRFICWLFTLSKYLVFTVPLRKLLPLASFRMTFQQIKAVQETIGCLGSGLNNQFVPRLLHSNTRRKKKKKRAEYADATTPD